MNLGAKNTLLGLNNPLVSGGDVRVSKYGGETESTPALLTEQDGGCGSTFMLKGHGDKNMITTIMMMTMITLIVNAAKKKQSRWRQMTLTGGHPKGATDWLKPNTRTKPASIQIATGEDFENDGWKIPDFLADKMKQVFLIIFDSDLQNRPLLIHQKSAVMAVLLWLRELTVVEHEENGIEVVSTDEQWELHFKKGKKQFDPYTMTANDISEGGA